MMLASCVVRSTLDAPITLGLVSLVPSSVVQQFIDRHFARAGVFAHRRAIFNYLDTMIAMVEAGEGTRYVGPHKGAFA